MIGGLRTPVPKQPIIGLYFESETVFKFYNLGTSILYKKSISRILVGITNQIQFASQQLVKHIKK